MKPLSIPSLIPVLLSLLVPPLSLQAIDFTVDGSSRHQEIDGFGTCLAWWITSPYDQAAFRTMYAQDLGASILRMELHPNALTSDGTLGGPPVILGDDIDANIALFNFNASGVANFGQVAAAVNAQKIDEFKLIGSLWTPPHWMKTEEAEINQFGQSTCGHLKQDAANLEQFGRYLAAFVKGFEERWGVPVYAVSIQNELIFCEPYNSCQYDSTKFGGSGINEYNPALKAVAAEFAANGIETKLIGPEDVGVGPEDNPWILWRQMTFIDDLRADTEAFNALDIYAIHGYAGDGVTAGGSSPVMWTQYWEGRPPGTPSWTGIGGDGKKSWMTETSGENYNWIHTDGAVQDGALSIAPRIHEALTQGNCSAWLYWIIAAKNSGTPAAGELTVGSDTQSKKYCAVKHYFRPIRPGAIRLGVTPDKQNQLYVSAFVHDQQETLAIVLANLLDAQQTAVITLPPEPNITSFEVFRTTATESYVQLPDVPASSATVSITMPAQSMVSLYGSALPDSRVEDMWIIE